MGREVVHHVVERLGLRESIRMAPEYSQEGIGFVISPALEVHLAVGVMEEGKHIQSPVTDILELLEPFAHPFGLQIRSQPLEDLDTRTLVKEEQVCRWIAIEADEVLHLGKELGIGDVQEVAGLVRFQTVTFQNTVQRRLAGCRAHCGIVHLQTAFSPPECPSSAAGQRLGLAVKCHDAQLELLRVDGRAPRTGMIMELSCPLGPPNPAPHATDRAAGKIGDGVERNLDIGQRDDRLSARQG